MKLLIALALLPMMTGCLSTSRLVRELAKDNATVEIHVRSPWASVDFVRSNPKVPAPIATVGPKIDPFPQFSR